MTRALILTAGFGEGHNAAARNLAEAFNEIAGPGSATVRDPLALLHPQLNDLARRIYLQLINRAPTVWLGMYEFIHCTPAISRRPFIPGLARQLEAIIDEVQPEVICSTFPLHSVMLARLTKRGRCRVPFFTIVTDSISINSIWWCESCDGWFLPNSDTQDVFLQAGIPASRLHVTGFPVQSFFSRHQQTLEPPDLARGRPRILQIVNSGTRDAAAAAKLLLAREGWDVTCVVGRNEQLRRELESIARARSAPTEILGWTDQVPRLLMTNHLVISKAGGATTQEAIAARCPMIVSQIVPGQEEGNYEWLRRHNAGAFAGSPSSILETVERTLADNGAQWRQWRRNLTELGRADGAQSIARHVLDAIGQTLPR